MQAKRLTLKDLKSELWHCAQILRGSAVDRTDWKGYILPLLFFKRISDVWDEETAEAREEYGDIAVPSIGRRFASQGTATFTSSGRCRSSRREAPGHGGRRRPAALAAVQ